MTIDLDAHVRLLNLERRVLRLELRESVLRDTISRRVLRLLEALAEVSRSDQALMALLTLDQIASATGYCAVDLEIALDALVRAAFVEVLQVVDGAARPVDTGTMTPGEMRYWRITSDGFGRIPS